MEIGQGNRAKLLSGVYGPEFTKETKSVGHWPCTGSLYTQEDESYRNRIVSKQYESHRDAYAISKRIRVFVSKHRDASAAR